MGEKKANNSYNPDAEAQYKQALEFYSLLDRDVAARFRSYVAMDGIREEVGFDSFDDLADMLSGEGELSIPSCSKDKSHKVTLYGKDRHGTQRYRCTECKKTFTVKSQTAISNTKKSIETWFVFIDSMYNARTISETAELCGVSQTAIILWQHKFFYVLQQIQTDIKLSGVIIADETFIPINYKGNVDTLSIANRKPRKRGNQNTRKNSNKNQACIVCALDNNGRAFSHFAGFGIPSKERIRRAFDGKIANDEASQSILVTDGSKAYAEVAHQYNMNWQRKVSKKIKPGKYVPDTSGQYNIQAINAYHKRLKAFLRHCQGVATRYLPGYLCLFDWRENNRSKSKKEIYIEALYAMSSIKGDMTSKNISQQFVPFIYEDQAKETWKSKVPVWQRNLYLDFESQYSTKILLEKYPQLKDARQVRRIVDRIRYMGLHKEMMEYNFELEEREFLKTCSNLAPTKVEKSPVVTRQERQAHRYEIYKDIRKGTIYKDAAIKYGLSVTAITNIAKYFDNSPLKIAKKKKERSNKGIIQAKLRDERKQAIIRTFLFYKQVNPSLAYLQLYEMAAKDLNCSAFRVRNVVSEYRVLHEGLNQRKCERKIRTKKKRTQSTAKYQAAFVKITERNSAIMAEYLSKYDENKYGFVQKPIAKKIADSYGLSLNTVRAIIYTYRNAGYTTLEDLKGVKNKPPQDNTGRKIDINEFKKMIGPALAGKETIAECTLRTGLSKFIYSKYLRLLRILEEGNEG